MNRELTVDRRLTEQRATGSRVGDTEHRGSGLCANRLEKASPNSRGVQSKRDKAPRALSRLSFKLDRALALAPPAVRTTPISRDGMFSLPFMASIAYVASPIPRLVCLEVVEALRPALRQRSGITVMRIKAVVNMTEK